MQLTAIEVEKAGGQDLILRAHAMRHAYREAPAGFLHVAGSQFTEERLPCGSSSMRQRLDR